MQKTDAIAALGALAQESRLDVFRLLVQAGTDGLPAGQIAERLNLPSATLSFHLKELTHAGLVTSRQEGRFVYYAPAIEHMNDLVGFLTENCCQGLNSAACTPKRKVKCKPKAVLA